MNGPAQVRVEPAGDDPSPRVPSIRTRLANALTLWSIVWGLAVGSAVWLAAVHEVDELLDDTLLESADLLAALVEDMPATAWQAPDRLLAPGRTDRFAWQVRTVDGELLLRSGRAPAEPWPVALGLGQVPGWRTHTVTLRGGQVLTVAQSQQERGEARADAALSAVLAALAIGLVGHVWLRARVGDELQPLDRLSRALETWDVDGVPGPPPLGPAPRRELVPVQRSLTSLAHRLASRLADERAFSAHAAHALRTPLAGIDAQLAVALRDSPAELQPRLRRAREAAKRLQTVVAALIGLFRTGNVQRAEVRLDDLVARLPTPGLEVEVTPGGRLQADADLLAAALSNLLDNAQRQGARRAVLAAGPGNVVRMTDDGPGVSEADRQALWEALQQPGGAERLGLGLVLADRVARAHGGRLRLPSGEGGFQVEIDLGASAVPAAGAGAVAASERR